MLCLFGLMSLLAVILTLVKTQLSDPALPGGQFGYTAEEAYRALGTVGGDGRGWFTVFQLVDLLFIPTYALLFATTISATARALIGRESHWRGLCLIPLLASLVDYVETGCLLILLTAYPRHLAELATVAGVVTTAKWSLVGGSALLASVGLLGVLVQHARAFHAGRVRLRPAS
jgi:hypothetical protein